MHIQNIYIYFNLRHWRSLWNTTSCRKKWTKKPETVCKTLPLRHRNGGQSPSLNVTVKLRTESIEWSIEDQAFSQSHYFAPPPPFPLSHQQVVSLSQSSSVSPVELTDRRVGERNGEGAKSYDSEKAWSSINHLILSGWEDLWKRTT